MSKILIGWLKIAIQRRLQPCERLEQPEHLNIEDCLRKAQEEKREIEIRSHSYVVCDLKINKEDRYIFGWLLKLSPQTKDQYFDSDQWKRKNEDHGGKHVKIGSRFIIFENKLIIFEDNYLLSHKTFETVLEKILKDVSGKFVSFEILLKRDIKVIKEFLANVDIITKITFKNIKIPNPIDIGKTNIQKAKEFINEQKIKELTYSNKDGLNIDGSITKGGLEYVQEGWWDAKLDAEKNHKKTAFNTRTKILHRRIDVIDDEDFITKSIEIKNERD